jgi:7-cyano-7-deazaguanine synthase
MTMNRPDPPAYVVVLASGGLDSTTLAYHLRGMGAKTRLLSFDYGQRHARELECARHIADGLGGSP